MLLKGSYEQLNGLVYFKYRKLISWEPSWRPSLLGRQRWNCIKGSSGKQFRSSEKQYPAREGLKIRAMKEKHSWNKGLDKDGLDTHGLSAGGGDSSPERIAPPPK